jgi:cytochrome c oxidase cbb3-type subunit 4
VDLNDIRNLVTLLSFVLFAGIVKWAWSRRNQAAFHEAEMLPFLDEPPVAELHPGASPRTRLET